MSTVSGSFERVEVPPSTSPSMALPDVMPMELLLWCTMVMTIAFALYRLKSKT